jgi:hypothetical protein
MGGRSANPNLLGPGTCGSPADEEVGTEGGRDWLPELGLRHVPGDVRRHSIPYTTQESLRAESKEAADGTGLQDRHH